MLSFVVAGLACIFAALCYAEFASMVPVAGSAYTYAYATLGELMAWIIGWDLVLEYAVGSSTVAMRWSAYFQALLKQVLGGYKLNRLIRTAPPSTTIPDKGVSSSSPAATLDLPALMITALITIDPGPGDQGEHDIQRGDGPHQAGDRGVRHHRRRLLHQPQANWTPFAPFGYTGLASSG